MDQVQNGTWNSSYLLSSQTLKGLAEVLFPLSAASVNSHNTCGGLIIQTCDPTGLQVRSLTWVLRVESAASRVSVPFSEVSTGRPFSHLQSQQCNISLWAQSSKVLHIARLYDSTEPAWMMKGALPLQLSQPQHVCQSLWLWKVIWAQGWGGGVDSTGGPWFYLPWMRSSATLLTMFVFKTSLFIIN